MQAHFDSFWRNARLGDNQIFSLGVTDGIISYLQPAEAPLPAGISTQTRVIDCQDNWLTPGLIDCHTHLVYAGHRANEFTARLKGQSYAGIAESGGGILSTVGQTRQASEAELYRQSLPRLQALMAEGVTCVEIKSGYGLDLANELKMLRVARQFAQRMPVRITTTLLAAHALPPEFAGDKDGYIDHVCRQILPIAAAEDLIDAVDMFCETIAFSIAQCERVMAAADALGLPVKIHAEQLTASRATEVACRHHAISADHLEYLSDAGIDAMRLSGTTAVLLPNAYYFLKQTRCPPVTKLQQAGIPIAVASDCNPGSAPFASLRMAMNQACVQFGMTPAAVLDGVTRHAARALGSSGQIGEIKTGADADFLVWNIQHPDQLAIELGPSRLRYRVFNGEVCDYGK